MSLRDEAITHMAQSQFGAGWWDSVAGEHDRNDALKIATEHLDALLDFLDEHTEEWAEAVPSAIGVSVKPFGLDKAIRFLIAALRGTTEEQ